MSNYFDFLFLTATVLVLNLVVAGYRTSITPGNRVILAGRTANFSCSSSYSPPRWYFYSLTPDAMPCRFDSSNGSATSVCRSYPRISAAHSSPHHNTTTLIIRRAEMSDAGTYVCGSSDPSDLTTATSVILGVIGKCTLV